MRFSAACTGIRRVRLVRKMDGEQGMWRVEGHPIVELPRQRGRPYTC